MKKNAWVILGIIILIIGVIVWQKNFFGQPATNNATGANSYANTVQSLAPAAAALAPDFTLPSLTGTTIHLADYRGRKPVILDFWATWCPNCRRDMPKFNALYEEYKDRIEVIGVDLQEDPGTVRDFVQNQGITFPVVIDAGDVANLYSIRYTNVHVLIKKDGTLFAVIPGDMTEGAFLNLLR